jgi:hypothetical protein
MASKDGPRAYKTLSSASFPEAFCRFSTRPVCFDSMSQVGQVLRLNYCVGERRWRAS